MKVKATILLLLCLILSLQVFGGTTGKIVGIVKDKTSGEGLIGVNILLEGTTLGATTDLDGSYLILNVPPGVYTLAFQYIGYRELQKANVQVSVDFTTTINVELEEATVELGETIQVVAEREVIRRDLTSSQAELTAEDIAVIPSQTFEDLLQLQAGIVRNDQGGFNIRGGRSSEIAFWVDGVSVTDVFDGSNGVEIENNAIQSLQVISGTFNAEYGQAMSGIINIVTKEGGDKYSGQVSAYMGRYFSDDSYNSVESFDPNNTSDVYLNLDDISATNIYNIQASLDGPVPFTRGKGNFFVNFRRWYDDGWLYGQRVYRADGDTIRLSNGRIVGTPGDGGIVPMNFNSWYTGQANLTYRLTNLIKLGVKLNGEDLEFREYDHYYKLNPDGDLTKFQQGYNTTFTFDHTLNATTFYNVKFSYFEKDFNQYVYENPEDPRYVDNTKFAVPAFNFGTGGQKNQHFNRNTISRIYKFDLTSQVTKKHLMKAGIETRFHTIYFQDYNVIDANQSDSLFTPIMPGPGDPNFSQYSFNPIEFSAYVQDKMEYNDFIVNLGLRMDYFDSKGRILRDPKDPNINSPILPENQQLSLEEREQIWYDEPSAKLQFSPRVGVAYPISTRGQIHFSYGHFLQIPEFRLLYENSDFRVTRENGIDNKIGNSDLDAQRTVMYEIGLQQELTNDIGFDVTGFYRDIRDWVGTSPLQETYAVDIKYSQYENRDYANVRGITFALRKRFSSHYSANIDYTFQVAEGNASNPDDAYNDIQNNKEPRKSIVPLDWDRKHVLTGNFYLGFGSFGASILGRFEGGLPYTPNPVQGSRVGSSISTDLQENSGRRPNLVTFDLQLFKDFNLRTGGQTLRWSLFAKIFNLFDTRNEQQVYDDTGRATYTLQSAISGATADPLYAVQPQFYTQPRRVEVGFSLGF
ncbi:MAG: carboxypeptidase-like regulatory domain-containing protein [Calditrichaceae bacterium]|nr:TonB-dependent receptor [Calditrichia bacterium]NUQ41363.1 carboxypeptidase-like regulatory domain-containing protein [Calditrichaceae bacterium]